MYKYISMKSILMVLIPLVFLMLLSSCINSKNETEQYSKDYLEILDEVEVITNETKLIILTYSKIWDEVISIPGNMWVTHYAQIIGVSDDKFKEYVTSFPEYTPENDYRSALLYTNEYFINSGKIPDIEINFDKISKSISELKNQSKRYESQYQQLIELLSSIENYIEYTNPKQTISLDEYKFQTDSLYNKIIKSINDNKNSMMVKD